MAEKRRIEVYSAGCSCCDETIALIRAAACPSCEITVLNIQNPEVEDRARHLGIRGVPAVVIDGRLADCCSNRGPQMETLKAAGLGIPLS
jgi:hypothetical protein